MGTNPEAVQQGEFPSGAGGNDVRYLLYAYVGRGAGRDGRVAGAASGASGRATDRRAQGTCDPARVNGRSRHRRRVGVMRVGRASPLAISQRGSSAAPRRDGGPRSVPFSGSGTSAPPRPPATRRVHDSSCQKPCPLRRGPWVVVTAACEVPARYGAVPPAVVVESTGAPVVPRRFRVQRIATAPRPCARHGRAASEGEGPGGGSERARIFRADDCASRSGMGSARNSEPAGAERRTVGASRRAEESVGTTS